MTAPLLKSIRKCFYLLLLSVCVILSNTAAKAQITFDIDGATATYVTGINTVTDICGYATFPGGVVKGFIYNGNDTTVIQYNSSNTWFGGINDAGYVVGRYNTLGGSFDYHIFVYSSNDDEYAQIPDLDGFENTMPNDINNSGWISGDLKDGVQRRIFTFSPDAGLATNFKTVAGTPMPTYGGHQIDDFGVCTAYWIEGITQKGTTYISESSQFSPMVINQSDAGLNPGNTVYKTQLMGLGNNKALLNFVQSKTAWTYDMLTNTVDQKIKFPNALYLFADCMNNEGYIAGNYTDAQNVIHGFFQAKVESGFKPNEDGWSFANSTEDVWPTNDYNEISYDKDPYWLSEYNEELDFPTCNVCDGGPYPSSASITWSEWVAAFGESQFYIQDPNVNHVEHNPNSMLVFRSRLYMEFAGACWGMGANAVVHHYQNDLYEQRYSTSNFYLSGANVADAPWASNRLFHVPPARTSQVLQYSQASYDQKIAGYFEAHTQIDEIYEMLTSESQHARILSVIVPGEEQHGFHILVPYKMERDPSSVNLYRIYVYDSNSPMDMGKIIMMEYNDTSSTHAYNFGDNWNIALEVGMRLDNPLPSLAEGAEIMSLNGQLGSRSGEALINFLNDYDVVITDDNNAEQINVTNGSPTNNIEGAQIFYPYNGILQTPREFYLPSGDYSIEAINTTSLPFISMMTNENGTVMFTRNDAQEGETDALECHGNQYVYTNNLGQASNIDAYILTSDETTSYEYYVDDIAITPNQSVGLQIIDATHLMITSNGAATNYDVRIRLYSPETGFWEAVASNVPIGTNVTQLIIPGLTDDTMDGIIIETDANQDGTYEGSEGFDNEGVPNMMLSISEVEVSNTGGSESFHVSNVGAGNLNWNVVYAPSWITVNTGATGVNHGPIDFTVAENTTSAGRQDYLIVEASAPANDQDTVLVIQGEGGVIGIDHIKLNGSAISMMPNPANERVQFAIDHDLIGNASYSIYTSTGQLVREGQMRGQKEIINTSHMKRGVYQVKFNLNGKIIIKKLVLS